MDNAHVPMSDDEFAGLFSAPGQFDASDIPFGRFERAEDLDGVEREVAAAALLELRHAMAVEAIEKIRERDLELAALRRQQTELKNEIRRYVRAAVTGQKS